MSFLDAILRADRPRRWADGTLYGDGRSVGDGIEAADVAFFGQMVFRRSVTTWTEES
jgi:hypothetical protein